MGDFIFQNAQIRVSPGCSRSRYLVRVRASVRVVVVSYITQVVLGAGVWQLKTGNTKSPVISWIPDFSGIFLKSKPEEFYADSKELTEEIANIQYMYVAIHTICPKKL